MENDTVDDGKEWGIQQKAAWNEKTHSDKGILTKTAATKLKTMGASEDFTRKVTQGMASSRTKSLITNKTLKAATTEKLEITQRIARWKLTKEKVGVDNGMFKIKSGLGARLKTLANPTTGVQRTEMRKIKHGKEKNAEKDKSVKLDTQETDGGKKRKRKVTDTIAFRILQ